MKRNTCNKIPRTILYNIVANGIKYSKKLDIEQIKQIFIIGLKIYLAKKITTFEIEGLASDLLFSFSENPKAIEKKDKTLSEMLLLASDLTYYEKKDKPDMYRIYEMSLKTLTEYLNKNKSLIEKMESVTS